MAWVWLIVAIVALAAAFYFAPKGWRTIFINGVVAVLTAVAGLVEAIQTALPDDWAIYGIVIVNVINWGLRYVTTTPVGKSA